MEKKVKIQNDGADDQNLPDMNQSIYADNKTDVSFLERVGQEKFDHMAVNAFNLQRIVQASLDLPELNMDKISKTIVDLQAYQTQSE